MPGTSENAEARLKASIPQTARVSTDGSVKVDVSYSGEPKFEPIDGTSLAYAVNTNEQVIKVGNQYFVLKDGVWFEGSSPNGPFVVAKAVPDEIYKIPPSSPAYNVTYVRVYKTEPDAVWYGYTMGYLGAYLAWDTYVYGTGWAYNDYWDYGWAGGGYVPYYPRPVSYGVGAFYNPAFGTFGRYGYAYGPYRGIAGGLQSPYRHLHSRWRCFRPGRRAWLHCSLQSAHRKRRDGAGRPQCLRVLGLGQRQAWLGLRAYCRGYERGGRGCSLAQLRRQSWLCRRRQGW